MTDKPTDQSEPTQANGQDQPLREDLRREHQLVRSTGAISKPVMVIQMIGQHPLVRGDGV